jgi:MFS family permease
LKKNDRQFATTDSFFQCFRHHTFARLHKSGPEASSEIGIRDGGGDEATDSATVAAQLFEQTDQEIFDSLADRPVGMKDWRTDGRLEKCLQHQIRLGRPAPVQRLPRDAGKRDDLSDTDAFISFLQHKSTRDGKDGRSCRFVARSARQLCVFTHETPLRDCSFVLYEIEVSYIMLINHYPQDPMSSNTLTNPGTTALLAVATLTIMVGSAIAPALPQIATALGMGRSASWLITLPSLGVIVFGPLAGRMITRQGARPALILGLALYGGFGILGTVPLSLPIVLLDRLLLGGATALIMSSGTALISEFFQGDARLTMIARQGMAIELGGVVFLSIGGVLAGFGWRFPFALYLAAWLMLPMIVLFVPRTAVPDLDIPSGSAFRQVGDIYVAATLSMVLFFVTVIALPRHLADQGFGEAAAGLYLAGISLIAVVAAGSMPRMRRMLGAQMTFLTAFGFYAAGYLIYAAGAGMAGLLVAAALMGAGFGFSIPLANHEVVERSTRSDRGRNLAWLSVTIFLGQFLSSFVELVSADGHSVFVVAFILSLAAAVVFVAISRMSETFHA